MSAQKYLASVENYEAPRLFLFCTSIGAFYSAWVRSMNGLTWDGTGRPDLSRETNFSGRERG